MHIFKMKSLKINPLSLHHEKLKKKNWGGGVQMKSKVNKRNEIIAIRVKSMKF